MFPGALAAEFPRSCRVPNPLTALSKTSQLAEIDRRRAAKSAAGKKLMPRLTRA
jgi:hypothetical protein